MDFSFTEEQLAIADAAERVFVDLCSDDAIKALSESKNPIHGDLWQQLAESGMLGLVVDEGHGGLGLSLVELCLIFELQGRFVAPVPLIATLVECAMTINACDNESLKGEVLPAVATGEMILSPVRCSAGLTETAPLVASNGDGWTLNGVSGVVPYASVARGFVVTAVIGNGDTVMLYCPADADGVTVVEQRMTSGELAGRVEFEDCIIAPQYLVAADMEAKILEELQIQNTYIALAALQVGVLAEGLKRTAEYVSQRRQFGRPLGAFQAVSQQAADAYMAIESLRSVYWRALDDIEHGKDAAMSARVAKFWVGEVGHKAAHTILHLHGGIGQDTDYPVHRYFLWGKHNERYAGTPDSAAFEVGGLIASNSGTVADAVVAE